MPEHKNLTGTELHEPKGVASATEGQYYKSDGVGSGTWTDIAGFPNVIEVKSLADFPTPSGGVIELVTTGADVYQIAAADIDIGSNRFTITGGSCTILGKTRFTSTISSTTTGDLITATNTALSVELCALDSPDSPRLINYSGDGSINSLCILREMHLIDCQGFMEIAGCFSTSFTSLAFSNSTVSGVLFTGSTNTQFEMLGCLCLGWTGTLIDFGTAVLDLISFSGTNKFISPSGTTSIGGTTGSANLTATGRGLVSTAIFNGDGTPLGTITPQDLKWTFSSNVFTDNVTKDTRVDTNVFLTASETVTIGSTGVYVPVNGTNWTCDIENRMSCDAAGVVTYNGLEVIDLFVIVTSTVEKVGGGSDVIGTKIAINGVVSDKTRTTTQSTDPTSVTSQGLFTLNTDDTIQLYTANEGSTANVVVSASNMLMNAV